MSLLGYLNTFASFFQVRRDKPVVDNVIFRLHYRFTCVFFLAASVLITAADLFGKPIDCIADNFKNPELLNTYCWIRHTFTIPVRDDQAHPGVGTFWETEERRIHAYYQWVPFALFFKGVLFYLPHAIWKRQEDGIIRRLTDGCRELNLATDKGKEDANQQHHSLVSNYFYQKMGNHGYLAVSHVLCEVFNLVNAVGSIYLIDLFLGGTFFDYGWKVFELNNTDQEMRRDKMAEVFPRMAKCTFHSHGASGTTQRFDALCILPLNVFNEKVYIYAWFWLIFLSVASALALIYRILVVVSPVFRHFVFRRFIIPSADRGSTAILSRKLPYPDCHLLFLLGKNLQTIPYRELLDDLANRLDNSYVVC